MQADDPQSKEIRDLKACIGDLLGILTLPAVWSGASSTRMASNLADVLTDALRADFVLVRLQGYDHENAIEISRNSTNWSDQISIEILNSALAVWLDSAAAEALNDVSRIQHNNEELSFVYSGIGLQNEFGVAIVGARRAEFPQQPERLLLKATVNQAVVCLQYNARLLEQQRRSAELDHLVSLKTAELAASHDKLVREITERTHIEATLAHANRVATIGQMSAAISHELRQPLSSVVTNSNAALNWLGNEPPNISEARQSLQRIAAEGLRAGKILDRTRRLMKKEPPKREAVDLNALLVETVTLVMSQARLRRVSIQTALDEHLPTIFVDRIQIQQVVLNLLSNAVEAVGATDSSSRDIHLTSSYLPLNVAKIVVSDTGPGIPHENLTRLFDAFFTTKADGLGLGLAICRSIVESHDGHLWVEAGLSGGATFHVSLPVNKLDGSGLTA
jgi:C4-dicarboxylate-specific signal transduction histidine kinase